MEEVQMKKEFGKPKQSCPRTVWTKLGDCCSLNCSLCYAIFSLWGFVMLMVVGALLEQHYTPLYKNSFTPEQATQAAGASYGAGGIYAALMVMCALRYIYLRMKARRQAIRM